jgi:hypothetical protein
MIEKVEELRPELQLARLREAEVFEDRRIHLV